MAQVRKNGKLVEVTDEEAAKYRVDSGMSPSTPTQPALAASQGAAPGQVAATGTPNQIQGSIAQGAAQTAQVDTSSKDSLAAVQRTDTGRTEATAAENATQTKVNKLGKIGSMGGRVQKLLDNQTSSLQDTSVKLYSSGDTSKDSLINIQLNTIADPSSTEAVINAAYTNLLEGGMTAEEVSEYLPTDTGTLGASAAEGIIDYENVTLDVLGLDDLGMTAEEMTELFGPEWGSMSLPQLQESMAILEQQEFSRIEGLRAELADPNTTPIRREQLMNELRDASQTGVSAAEVDFDSVNTSVINAEIIDGQSLESLLNDENITRGIQDFLTATEGSDSYNAFLEANPGLGQWVLDNKATMTELGAGLDTAGQAYTEVVAANKLIVEDLELSPELAAELGIGKGRSFDKETYPGLALILDNPDTDTSTLKQLAAISPAVFKDLSVDPDLLTYMEDPNWSYYVEEITQQKAVSALDANSTMDDISEALFGEGSDWNVMAAEYEAAQAAGSANSTVLAQYDALFDADGDGVTDDLQTIISTIRKLNNTSTVASNFLQDPNKGGLGSIGPNMRDAQRRNISTASGYDMSKTDQSREELNALEKRALSAVNTSGNSREKQAAQDYLDLVRNYVTKYNSAARLGAPAGGDGYYTGAANLETYSGPEQDLTKADVEKVKPEDDVSYGGFDF